MGSSWDWKTNISEVPSTVNKSPLTANLPPKVQNAALFQGNSDDANVYLYGGSIPTINTSFRVFQAATTEIYTLWGLDTVTDVWTQYSFYDSAPERPSWGAQAEAPDLALAFYFNGMLSKSSSIEAEALGDEVVFLESMVIINLTNHTPIATNVSTSVATNGSPRIGAEMIYIGGLGKSGIIVVIGGASGTLEFPSLSSMEEILIRCRCLFKRHSRIWLVQPVNIKP